MLPQYNQLRIREIEENVFVGEMIVNGRKSFNLHLIDDITDFFMYVFKQENINNKNRFFVLTGEKGSGVFNIGGDLSLFLTLIENKDILALQKYGRKCIDLIYKSTNAKNHNMTTVAILNGHALGGGLESALACDIIIAEKGYKVSFPEIKNGFFPGMGAFELLSKRIGEQNTKKLILSGKEILTESFYEIGGCDYLVEQGEGESELLKIVKEERENQTTYNSLRKIFSRESDEKLYTNLIHSLDLWVDSIINISDRKKRKIKKIINLQNKL